MDGRRADGHTGCNT